MEEQMDNLWLQLQSNIKNYRQDSHFYV
jgi:hypothetical protein